MGLFDKPKTPEPSAIERSTERRLRRESNELTEEENRRIKAARRGRSGRRALLSGTFIPGRNPSTSGGGAPASARGGAIVRASGGVRTGGGGVMSSRFMQK